eukprot:gnl/Spiro4/24502_TR12142_c0_g1_i1.p1 gnl/Spiro4/24502_TR12142_c0_g1~~gnl/Spiro4/24502_TR12142_c0_g1_i1.p1  ORF type:complete len:191 (+),score=16.43 gnl/Spiro4/24502_TR12142_c0_g1_i1:96-668(+)
MEPTVQTRKRSRDPAHTEGSGGERYSIRCRGCNNVAKRECDQGRCRTCCLKLGLICSIHTLVPDEEVPSIATSRPKRSRTSVDPLVGRPLTGTVRTLFEHGVTVTVVVDGQSFKGIVFSNPEFVIGSTRTATASASSVSAPVIARRTRRPRVATSASSSAAAAQLQHTAVVGSGVGGVPHVPEGVPPVGP